MKYAAEVIDLLAAYPGRRFKMAQIIRHATQGRELSPAQRHSVRIGIGRVLSQLQDTGQVVQVKEGATFALYAWNVKLTHEVRANCYAN